MKKLAFIYIVLACIFWGTSGIFVNYVAPFGISSVQMTFIRGLVFLICLGIFLLLKNRSLFKAKPSNLILYALGGLSFFLTATFYFLSMQLTSISTAVILMYTAPIFVMIYSVSFMGEAFNFKKGLSVGLMIIGCALVSGIIGGLKFDLLGIIIGFLSGLSYSAYNIVTKMQMNKKSHPLTANFYCFLFATCIGFIFAKPFDIPGMLIINPGVRIPLVILMGISTCVLPYFFYTLGLKEIDAGTATSLGILEPVAATLFSVIIFNEKLDVYSIAGICLILGAVFLLSKADSEKTKKGEQ